MGRWAGGAGGRGAASGARECLCPHVRAGNSPVQLQAGAQRGPSSRTLPPFSGLPCLAPQGSPSQIGSIPGGVWRCRSPRAPGSSPLCTPRLSGLSPFLGDNDAETLNNVLAANWYFDEETFESVSDEAKDFVSNLIIKQKRCGAGSGRGGPGVDIPRAACPAPGYHVLPSTPGPAASPGVLCQMSLTGPCPGCWLSPAEPCVSPGSPAPSSTCWTTWGPAQPPWSLGTSLWLVPPLQVSGVLGLLGGWRRGWLGQRGSSRGDLGSSHPQRPDERRPVPAASLAQQPGRKGQALQPPAQVPGAAKEIRHAAALEGAWGAGLAQGGGSMPSGGAGGGAGSLCPSWQMASGTWRTALSHCAAGSWDARAGGP